MPAQAAVEMGTGGIVAILMAGFAAGIMNAVVGAGSLVTFPVLLAVGYPPVVTNISNTVGLVFGNVSGVVGYRRELKGQGSRFAWLALPSVAGAALGAVLLLSLPQRVFTALAPVLIVFAIVLVLAQPTLSRRFTRKGPTGLDGLVLSVGVFLACVYGGYFGVGLGLLLISLLAVLLTEPLVRLNALRNAISMVVNGVAAVIFLFLGHVSWEPAALVAVSSIIGGQVGASVGRRMSPRVLRGVIVVAGLAAIAKLVR